MAARNHLIKVILASLLHTLLLIRESSQTSSKFITKSTGCLKECNAISATRSKTKEQGVFSSCYQLCLRRVKGQQQRLAEKTSMIKRTRRALPPNYNCPPSSSAQSTDWSPSHVNVCFGQYRNTSNWYINVSWTPMNDSNGTWNGTLVRLGMSHGFTLTTRMTCFLQPKNQTFISINVSRYGYRYPDVILLKVLGFPYSKEEDVSGIQSFYPARSAATVLPNSEMTNTSNPNRPHTSATTTPPNHTKGQVTYIVMTNISKPKTSHTSAPTTTLNHTKGQESTYTTMTNTSNPNTAYTTASPTTSKQTTVYVSISIGALIGIILVAVLIGLLKYFVCHKKTIVLPQEFDYDAFIIYNHEDQLWVTEKLLGLLEGKYNLKCCVHFRDFPPGKPFYDTMAECVYKSYKIVAVLSNSFLKSSYCNYELNVAKYRLLNRRDDSLIMIRIDGSDSNKLPRQLRKRNFIDYHSLFERPFWEEKLLKFLQTQNGELSIESGTSQRDFCYNINSKESSVSVNGKDGRTAVSRLNSTTSNTTEISTVTSTDDETTEQLELGAVPVYINAADQTWL